MMILSLNIGGNMGAMNQQLLELRGEYASQLQVAEHQVKDLQARISDWRGKIAAIDTLTGGPETDCDDEEEIAEPQEESFEDGVFTPVHAYWRPILQVLVDMGGRGKRLKVVDAVGKVMEGVLTKADYGKLPKSGWTRWRNRVIWQASNMRQPDQGLIKGDSPRGIWEISDAGRKWLDHN
jgi:Mrr N-terminal domain